MRAQESMRLQPVASQAVRRVTTRDVRLRDGRCIPAGTTITGSNYSMMRNPAWWGPDAGEFKPVRLHI
jgi:cytochrome P450